MRVVPLFETLDDLERSPKVVEVLFSTSAYRDRINSKQEIMVGYSDSSKDAGRWRSVLLIYILHTQDTIIHSVDATFL